MWKRLVDAYRWRRILSSCRLDPHSLSGPLVPPGEDDFIVAGCPRTGTSLLAAVLHRPPGAVMVMEPWDGLRLEPADLFRSLRQEIAETNRLSRGRLDLDALGAGAVRWHRDGERVYDLQVADDFKLGIKWPTFWQYLDLLPETRFLITLRHPIEVIASFARVGGRLADGLEYDVPFNASLNRELEAATPDPAVRRALLYQHINARLLPSLERENVFVVRYERWFTDPERLIDELSAFLGVRLEATEVNIEPARRVEPSPEFIDLVRRNVPVAGQLGYDLPS